MNSSLASQDDVKDEAVNSMSVKRNVIYLKKEEEKIEKIKRDDLSVLFTKALLPFYKKLPPAPEFAFLKPFVDILDDYFECTRNGYVEINSHTSICE